MASDPKQYRRNAWRCIELANDSRAPELRRTLFDLSETWLKLAVEIERNHVLMDKGMHSAKWQAESTIPKKVVPNLIRGLPRT